MTQNNTEKISLFDGSGIEIAQNTIIRYPVREKGVTVRLVVLEKGKATFRVAKGDLPFLVYAHPLEIKVTGTVFNVEKNVFGVFITNEEGKVEVYKPNSKINPVQLEKGDKIKIEDGEIFTALGGNDYQQITFFTSKSIIKIEKMQKDSSALAQAKPKLSGKNDVFRGSKYRMTDVILFLEKTFKKQLKFKKKRKFKTESVVMLQLYRPVDKILEMLKNQDVILFVPGKKEGAYIVSPPEKKR
jgi:hypothetical protein